MGGSQASKWELLVRELRQFANANSTEARACIVGEELRQAACQGAAQAYCVAAEMVESTWLRKGGVA
jgi:hypothetical protein